MCHHALLVTSWDLDSICEAQWHAARLFPWVSPLSPVTVNGYRSFFVPPDGSKEGWAESDEGDHLRDMFIAWLRAQVHEDGSTSLDWAEVQFGDEDGEQRVLRASGMEEIRGRARWHFIAVVLFRNLVSRVRLACGREAGSEEMARWRAQYPELPELEEERHDE